ncbi:MAG: aldo/keto reductase [Verrucomicrobiota bacterium]
MSEAAPTLPRRALGRSGLEASVIGLGTVKLGRNQGVKYPKGFELPTDAEATVLLETARELGINLIDTAPAYGVSEERLGKLLPGPREDWLIATKVGEEFRDGASQHLFTPAHTRASVERSLQRLQTDHLDLVLVHSDGQDLAIVRESGVLEELATLKGEGKLRAFGMSTKTVEGGLAAAERSDVMMITYSPWQREEEPVLDDCARRGVGVLVKKAFASGHFGATADQDPVRTAFDFIFAHPAAGSVITGTLNPDHLRQNVAAATATAAAPN